MLEVSLRSLRPKTDVLAGVALGQKHAAGLRSVLSAAPVDGDRVVLLDFDKIKAVTPSYLKQTLPVLYEIAETESTRTFPLYENLSTSAEDDLDHFLIARRLPGILVKTERNSTVFEKRIGWLEPAANETLSRLSAIGSGSAADVMAMVGGSAIALTAWNNRLAELFRLRLATRAKNGRYWIYKPIVEAKNNG